VAGHLTFLPLGPNIVKARTDAGLTQVELAEAIDVTQVTVSCWETGTRIPSSVSLAKLVEVLGVSAAWLYTDHEEERAAA
jgi:transcriptional regulator with XRE-family HTH domain